MRGPAPNFFFRFFFFSVITVPTPHATLACRPPLATGGRRCHPEPPAASDPLAPVAAEPRAVPAQPALRTALLCAVWQLRCRRVAWGTQFAPADAVAACIEDLRRTLLADWRRATADITRMDGVSSRLFPRRGRLAEAFGVGEFEAKWCSGGAVAYVAHRRGQRPAVEIRLETPSGEVR